MCRAGQVTKASGHYPIAFARKIYKALLSHHLQLPDTPGKALAQALAAQCSSSNDGNKDVPSNGNHDNDDCPSPTGQGPCNSHADKHSASLLLALLGGSVVKDTTEPQQQQQLHREKQAFYQANVLGLVTKVLSKRDLEFHSEGAKAALTLEMSRLELAGVWDAEPVEHAAALKANPSASFSRIFAILGLKDSETSTAKFKARAVLQGNDMRDADGEQVYFQDTSSAPTSMSCIRSVMAYGQLSGGGSSQTLNKLSSNHCSPRTSASMCTSPLNCAPRRPSNFAPS